MAQKSIKDEEENCGGDGRIPSWRFVNKKEEENGVKRNIGHIKIPENGKGVNLNDVNSILDAEAIGVMICIIHLFIQFERGLLFSWSGLGNDEVRGLFQMKGLKLQLKQIMKQIICHAGFISNPAIGLQVELNDYCHDIENCLMQCYTPGVPYQRVDDVGALNNYELLQLMEKTRDDSESECMDTNIIDSLKIKFAVRKIVSKTDDDPDLCMNGMNGMNGKSGQNGKNGQQSGQNGQNGEVTAQDASNVVDYTFAQIFYKKSLEMKNGFTQNQLNTMESEPNIYKVKDFHIDCRDLSVFIKCATGMFQNRYAQYMSDNFFMETRKLLRESLETSNKELIKIRLKDIIKRYFCVCAIKNLKEQTKNYNEIFGRADEVYQVCLDGHHMDILVNKMINDFNFLANNKRVILGRLVMMWINKRHCIKGSNLTDELDHILNNAMLFEQVWDQCKEKGWIGKNGMLDKNRLFGFLATLLDRSCNYGCIVANPQLTCGAVVQALILMSLMQKLIALHLDGNRLEAWTKKSVFNQLNKIRDNFGVLLVQNIDNKKHMRKGSINIEANLPNNFKHQPNSNLSNSSSSSKGRDAMEIEDE